MLPLAFSLVFFDSSIYAQDFTVGNADLRGSRSIPSGESKLSRAEVEKRGLKVKWFTSTDQPVQGVPIVGGKVVYAGTANLAGAGSMYAFDANSGVIKWHKPLNGGVLASPLLDGDNLYVGTLDGTLYALEAKTGKTLWSYQPKVAGFFDSIWAGPIKIRNMIVFAINPQDEFASFDPPGVSAVIAVDARTGADTQDDEIWRFTPVPTKKHNKVGGAGIWGTSPSYSESLDLIFLSTGQTTFSNEGKSTPGSDSVFAIEASTGEVRWQNQVKKGDVWNFSDPFDPLNPGDMDVGEAPAVFELKGKEFVAVGSKRGYFYVMDAETGKIQNGRGKDALGFKYGLDLFEGVLPGPSVDGGFNLDSGYIENGGAVIHFGILNDYSVGLTAVADGKAPFLDRVCFIAGFGGFPECPSIDFGHLVLINGNGTEELGRYSNPNAPIFSPVHLDDMIFVHEAADATMFENNKLLVIDVSDPSHPTLMEEVGLIDPASMIPAFSGGAHVSIGNNRIYTGNGFFGFSSPGLFSIGL